MIYLDNAATTNYKPQTVIDAVTECITKYPFNPNRGGSKHSLELQQKIYDTRRKLSLLYNNDSDNHVVFTAGCTAALNLAILGNARKGHIILTATEHNSVLRPVMQLERKGYAEVSVAEPNENGEITVDELSKYVRKDTYMLCVSHSSNVTGQMQSIAEIGLFAKRHNIILLVDCAQSVGYVPLDMKRCNVDLVAIGAHKGLHAVQGVGALIFNENAVPRPITFGGTGTESHLYYQPSTVPDSLESGTLPCPAIIGMSAGIDYWLENWKQNRQNILETQNIILEGLKNIDGVTVYSKPNYSGITSFNVRKLDSGAVADELAQQYDIVTRGGLQCAPLMHKWLNTTEQGIVRTSVSCVTTKNECYSLLNSIEAIAKKGV